MSNSKSEINHTLMRVTRDARVHIEWLEEQIGSTTMVGTLDTLCAYAASPEGLACVKAFAAAERERKRVANARHSPSLQDRLLRLKEPVVVYGFNENDDQPHNR